MLQWDIGFEQFEEIFEGDIIKDSLIFEDAFNNVHKDVWFILDKDGPSKVVFQGLDFNTDPTLISNKLHVDAIDPSSTTSSRSCG